MAPCALAFTARRHVLLALPLYNCLRVDSGPGVVPYTRVQAQLHTEREDGDQNGCRVAQRAGGRCEPGATSSLSSPLSGRCERPPDASQEPGRGTVADDGVAHDTAPRVDAPRGSVNQGGTASDPRPCRARVFLWPRPWSPPWRPRHEAVPRVAARRAHQAGWYREWPSSRAGEGHLCGCLGVGSWVLGDERWRSPPTPQHPEPKTQHPGRAGCG